MSITRIFKNVFKDDKSVYFCSEIGLAQKLTFILRLGTFRCMEENNLSVYIYIYTFSLYYIFTNLIKIEI